MTDVPPRRRVSPRPTPTRATDASGRLSARVEARVAEARRRRAVVRRDGEDASTASPTRARALGRTSAATTTGRGAASTRGRSATSARSDDGDGGRRRDADDARTTTTGRTTTVTTMEVRDGIATPRATRGGGGWMGCFTFGCFGTAANADGGASERARETTTIPTGLESALETTEDGGVVVRDGDVAVRASSTDEAREAAARERERVERDARERETRLRSEEEAVRRREREVIERETRVVERERALEQRAEDVERQLAALRSEEKRLLDVSHGARARQTQSSSGIDSLANDRTDGGGLMDVGEAGLRAELARVRKTTKQFTEKERAMLEQINALRRARDASESRVLQLADELKDTKKDYEMWANEEKVAERKYGGVAHAPPSPAESTPSPKKSTIDDRDLPDWLRSPEPERRDFGTSTASLGVSFGSPTYKKFSPGKLIIPEDDAETRAVRRPADGVEGAGGQHPIFSAVRNGRVREAQEILVDNLDDFDVDTRDSFGNTVLIVAAQNNRKRVTKMCVRAGVPLDATNKQGNTALHYCYGYGYFELGEYLVNKGADPNSRNAAGQTPYDGVSSERRRALEALRAALARARRPLTPPIHRTNDAHIDDYADVDSVVAYTDDDDA